MKTFESKIEQFNSNLWDYHFMVPEDVAEYFILKEKTRRVICSINQQVSMHSALMHDGNGQFFININKENRKKLGLEFGNSIQVEIRSDESKYGIPLPEEMKYLLEQDDIGSDFFHKLTPGKQRSLLHIVGKVKSSEIRINKSLVILNFLKDNNGILDFKLLNTAFKEANKRF